MNRRRVAGECRQDQAPESRIARVVGPGSPARDAAADTLDVNNTTTTKTMSRDWMKTTFGATRPFMAGIGGCGMSGLARLLAGGGGRVSGCDTTRSTLTESLEAHGIGVVDDAAETRLPEDCDLLIVSAAVHLGHPLVVQATERGLRVLTYAEALGAAMAGMTGVAIAGTHGKSTTTADRKSVV